MFFYSANDGISRRCTFAKAIKEQENDDPYIPNIGEWLKRDYSEEINQDDIELFRAEAAELEKFEEDTEQENNG